MDIEEVVTEGDQEEINLENFPSDFSFDTLSHISSDHIANIEENAEMIIDEDQERLNLQHEHFNSFASSQESLNLENFQSDSSFDIFSNVPSVDIADVEQNAHMIIDEDQEIFNLPHEYVNSFSSTHESLNLENFQCDSSFDTVSNVSSADIAVIEENSELIIDYDHETYHIKI